MTFLMIEKWILKMGSRSWLLLVYLILREYNEVECS